MGNRRNIFTWGIPSFISFHRLLFPVLFSVSHFHTTTILKFEVKLLLWKVIKCDLFAVFLD